MVNLGYSKPNKASLPEPIKETDYLDVIHENDAKIKLGRALFFDKILSGNLNISCATCHHPMAGTSDGWSLPIGEGGRGIGVTRNTGEGDHAIHERVPRNSPSIFNLGAKEFQTLFHDGRLTRDANQPSGFVSPAGDDLPMGLESPLAAQAMFPITSGTEMAGQLGENPQADFAAAGDLPAIWDFVAEKLKAVDEYVNMFEAAYGIGVEDISMVYAANAIAAFESVVFRSDNSPFDRYLRGEKSLNRVQKKGMRIFYGKGQCATCHSGPFQTDQAFHAIAMPQIGNGKGDGIEGREDFGRSRVTADDQDRFKFRTPSLRNVVLTAPYGHSGAYNLLSDVVRHHLDPLESLYNYDLSMAKLPKREDLDVIDGVVMSSEIAVNEIAQANELKKSKLSEREIVQLLEFLQALTDPKFLDMRDIIPSEVPSGLPVFD